MSVSNILTPTHPKWEEFIDQLCGEEHLDCCTVAGALVWDCPCDEAKPHCREILERMGLDVAASLEYFEQQGGHCDCEVAINVGIQ